MKVESRYIDGSYFKNNPTWDRVDSPWKAKKVSELIKRHHIIPRSICEVGCGAGDVLRELVFQFSDCDFYGYDVAPQLESFWTDDIMSDSKITFFLADFNESNIYKYDIVLALDVFEHVRDPFTFLEQMHLRGHKFVFHIPLDLSASSVLRGKPLLESRHSVGHLNFYTKDLALETLIDCGYKIIDWQYTSAYLAVEKKSIKAHLALLPRLIGNFINNDVSARLFGGETLIVLAE